MTVTDNLWRNAERYAAHFDQGHLPMPPARHGAIVTGLDARVHPYGICGLAEGDAHVIRNAGGAITDDAIGSLAILPAAPRDRGVHRRPPRRLREAHVQA